MNNTMPISNMILFRMPEMKKVDPSDLTGKAGMLRRMGRENTRPENMSRVELVRLLESLRRQYYDLLGCEPEEDRVLIHNQWREDMLRLRSRIQELKACLAA